MRYTFLFVFVYQSLHFGSLFNLVFSEHPQILAKSAEFLATPFTRDALGACSSFSMRNLVNCGFAFSHHTYSLK